MMKKIMSFVLAATMIFSNLTYLKATKAQALATPTIQFVNNLGPTKAQIIEGNSVGIVMKNNQNYMLGTPKFYAIKQGDDSKDYNDMFDFSTEGLIVAKQGSKGAYGVKANYFALEAQGTAIERWTYNSKDNVRSASVTCLEPNAIMDFSTIKISATDTGTDANPPTFQIEEDGKGVFGTYKKNDTVTSNYTTYNGKKAIEVHFYKPEGGHFALVLVPQQKHDEIKDEDGNVVTPAHDYVVKDTIYEIRFETAMSGYVMLEVFTAEDASNEVKKAILDKNSYGNYIKLQNDDSLDWITGDFNLVTKTEKYAADVSLTWEWVPDDPKNNGAIEKIVPSGGDQTSVKVNQLEDDAPGKLNITVQTTGKFNDATEANDGKSMFSVPITVKGRGKPAYVKLLQQQVGQKPWEDIVPPEKAHIIDYMPKNMDVFDDSVAGYTPNPAVVHPHIFNARAYMGEKNGAAEYLVVTSTNPDAIVMRLGNNPAPIPYGTKIENPDKQGQGSVLLSFVANKADTTTRLTFEYFGKGNGGKIESFYKKEGPSIHVEDSTPSKDTSLETLDLYADGLKDYGGPKYDYGFVGTELGYNIEVPYKADKITFLPVLNDPKADKNIQVVIDGVEIETIQSGKKTSPIVFVNENEQKVIRFRITAQNPNISSEYVLKVTRQPASNDATLKALELITEKKYESKQMLNGFTPQKLEYNVEVPFKINKLKVNAVPNSIFVDSIIYTPALQPLNLLNKVIGLFTGDKDEWVELEKPTTEASITKLDVAVTAENQIDTLTYTANITRLPPSRVATLDAMQITDYLGNEIKYIPQFNKEIDSYDVNIPYITEYLKFNVTPTDDAVSKIVVTDADGSELQTIKPNQLSKKIAVPYMLSDMKPYVLKIKVIPESEEEADAEFYTVNVMREPPSNDAQLKSLEIHDQDKNKLDLNFFPNVNSYNLEVPYEVSKVTVTPTAAFEPVEKITVNNRKVESGNTSSIIRLEEYPSTSTITVQVLAEDESTTQTYTINIKRLPPSNESLLKSLTITGTEKLDPIFIPDRYDFEAKATEGSNAVTVTPTAMHDKAIIKVNGKTVESGSASETIDLLYVETDIEIEVTAQNGTTKSTYEIEVTNENLIEKTDDATLKSLKIENGILEPRFKPSTTEYTIYVKEDNAYIDIIPKTYDKYAEMKVFKGTKEIGDDEGNYSESLKIGENEFTIEVTSSDESKTKKYELMVYRDDEDNLGPLKPVLAEDIDYENDKNAIVDITKYTIISGEVFNTLMEYPDNTITFVGNDYSLKFKGSDITKLVPHAKTYDFGMTFTLPDELEESVDDLVYSRHYRSKLKPVYMYFFHHGALPGTAIFSISLGSEYKNDILYWNYYNEERDRIDYYGYVETNSKGTFTVPIDHFSVYISTMLKLYEAENKAGSASVGDLSKGDLTKNIKIDNPYTATVE